MKIAGRIVGSYPASAVTAVLNDLDRLASTVPGLEAASVEQNRFFGTMKVQLPFMVLSNRVEGTFTRTTDGGLTLTVKGQAIGLAGLFQAQVTLDPIPPDPDAGIGYSLELQTFGRLASLGDAMLGKISKTQADRFETNLRNLLGEETGHGR